MKDNEKIENLKGMLEDLIITCKSEIKLTEKMIANTKNTRGISKLNKEKAFWQGKLEVSEYVKYFI